MRANPVAENPDEQDASQLMRQGTYFDHARQWYTAMYIGPISERSFFLVLGVLAVLVGLCGFAAIMGLTPLTEKPPVVIANPRINDTIPELIRLRAKGQDINDALRDYYVRQYVVSREGYRAGDFQRDAHYVAAHSDRATATAYLAAVGNDNPRNPVALLGVYGIRNVEIRSVDVQQGENNTQRAIVRFSTELKNVSPESKTQWTATIDFTYSDAVVNETTDPETGKKTATLTQPEFQVVSYALAQAP